ncbi:MAG: hypothetical protein U5L72_05765 [Bacteroidales bacterium]|nr:hypothetical protein [Bacteroidales bacterium]
MEPRQRTASFLKILEIVSFDENLFRKEFIKTLDWVSKEDYAIIEDWMRCNHFSDQYPDLLKLVVTHRSSNTLKRCITLL